MSSGGRPAAISGFTGGNLADGVRLAIFRNAVFCIVSYGAFPGKCCMKFAVTASSFFAA